MNKDGKIACIDLDGIILKDYDGEFEFGEFGEPKENAKWGIGCLMEMGYEIVVWTCRGNVEAVIKYLEKHEIPYDYVNYHPLGHLKANVSRKVYADVYIDDRGLNCPTEWVEIVELIRDIEQEEDNE